MCQQAGKPAEREEAEEASSAPRLLESRPEQVERIHVRGEMPESAADKHERDRRPPAFRESAQRETERRLESAEDSDELQVVNRDIDRNERLNSQREAGVFALRSLHRCHRGVLTHSGWRRQAKCEL